MVSAPPLIAWRYNVQPQPGSAEERLVQVLRSPREWA
jgi:coproporphyrinogen III oxidase